MTFSRFLVLSTVAVFGCIGVLAFMKKKPESEHLVAQDVQEVIPLEEKRIPEVVESVAVDDAPKEVDRIRLLFTTGPNKLPIVETVKYTSRVPWLKGRPAWITDYASYYNTSRHFIARSLNGKPDYFTQKVSSGNKFNVYRKDKNFDFHLIVDLSKCKMFFYYHDVDTNERMLLKSYTIGVGRKEENSVSGSLTPLGKYRLGDKVAIYKEGVMGYFQDNQVEMIQVFGTRWIPFAEEVEGCSEDARGYGIHGAPWYHRAEDGVLVEDRDSVTRFESDGCIRLMQEDMEELFSVVISKPTYVQIVKTISEAQLPGIEAEE